MTSPIEHAIRTARSEGGSAFIPYLTGGFPDTATCEEILVALAVNGADVIEVGLPFSDPLADGPTIQSAAREALDQGVTPDSVFEIISRVKARIPCPMVLMTYVNPVFKLGVSEFARTAKEAGVDGVIIPDLPLEEADDWLTAAEGNRLDTIFLVAPTTPPTRMEKISARTSGFLYYVSMTGVTGSGLAVSDEMLSAIKQAKAIANVPVAVGFGVSDPEQARALSEAADGVIVGSALIREIQSRDDAAGQVHAASTYAASLSQALKPGTAQKAHVETTKGEMESFAKAGG